MAGLDSERGPIPPVNPASELPAAVSRTRAVVLSVAIVGAFWLAGALAAPALEAGGHQRVAAVLRVVHAPMCHQIEERCFTLAGGPVAVCARCTGLYVGGTLGLCAGAAMLAWRRRWPAWVFFAAVAPTVAQWLAVRIGIPEPGAPFRFVVSIPAGFVCGWFLAHALGDLVEGPGTIPGAAPARALRERPGA